MSIYKISYESDSIEGVKNLIESMKSKNQFQFSNAAATSQEPPPIPDGMEVNSSTNNLNLIGGNIPSPPTPGEVTANLNPVNYDTLPPPMPDSTSSLNSDEWYTNIIPPPLPENGETESSKSKSPNKEGKNVKK